MSAAADRHLLFGLLALQNGLIQQTQLVAAFHAWTCNKSRSLADHLLERGDLDADDRGAVEALVARHLKRHGGGVEQSLAAFPASRAVRVSLAALGEPEIEATLARVARSKNGPVTEAENGDPERTAGLSVGESTSDGQRFRVLRPYARGGLGEVFVALDAELHREVALKQILEKHADDPTSRQRFVAEAEITGGLEHPGVVPVYGLGSYGDGRPYYAMRFINGDSLKEAIEHFQQTRGPRELELRKLLRRFLDVCNAIDYAHSRGVIHRDIKPANIIVGKYGETLVVDWGLAKAIGRADHSAVEQTLVPSSGGSSETLPGSALGTPAYMSPEQACGDLDRIGPRTDVYSLGATLYCLLTGKPPFEGEDIGVILRAVQQGHFVRPSQLAPSFDKALEAICLKAMATKPEDRYPTPKALADDIERWEADEPVTAWREPLVRQARRWGRRHRTSVTAAAVAVLAILFGTAAVLAVQSKANGELKAANTALAAAKDREAKRFDLAMEAIRLFHGEVGGELVLKEDKFKPLRDRLLRGAADFYRKLEGLLKDQPDRASRRELGQAYTQLGRLNWAIGDKSDSLEETRKSLSIYRSLVSNDPTDNDSWRMLAYDHGALGWRLWETGKTSEAEAAYLEKLIVTQRLADEYPSNAWFRYDLASIHSVLGNLRAETGRHSEAESDFHKARHIFLKLIDDSSTEPRFRHSFAWSCYDYAWLMTHTGQTDQAGTNYRDALGIFQKEVEDRPSDAGARSSLAHTLNMFGWLLFEMGKPLEAEIEFEKALPILKKLADENPADTDIQLRLAIGRNFIGWLKFQTGTPLRAEIECRLAQAVLRRLTDDNPSSRYFRSSLGFSHTVLGYVLLAAGQPAEAETAFREALAIQQTLVDDSPAVTHFRDSLGRSQRDLARVLLLTERPDEALRSSQRAIAIFQELARAYPTIPLHRGGLASTLILRADALRALGHANEARADLDQAIALSEELIESNPTLAGIRSAHAYSLCRRGLARLTAGAVDDARRAAAMFEGLPSRSGDDWYNLACCHSELAGAAVRGSFGVLQLNSDAEAQKAMSSLRQAVAAGYRNAAVMDKETALDPLRSRPDFQILMMDLAFPAEPFAP